MKKTKMEKTVAMDKYDAEEGYDRLIRAWTYLLDTYKRKDELPEEYWDAEELIKHKLWELYGEFTEIEHADGSTITLNQFESNRRAWS